MIFPTMESISREQRISVMKQHPYVVWLTGLSGSGKSTMALALESRLTEMGFKTYLLDGDIVRAGLNKDLGFSENDRRENIRRIGEVCRLMNDAGLIVITAFISPFISERNFVRSLIPSAEFAEVFVNSPLQVCEARDVKGLYGKARKGIITEFTGIDSPYEQPVNPEVVLHTDNETEEESLDRLLDYLLPKIKVSL